MYIIVADMKGKLKLEYFLIYNCTVLYKFYSSTLICSLISIQRKKMIFFYTGFIQERAPIAWPVLFFKKFYMVILRDFNLC